MSNPSFRYNIFINIIFYESEFLTIYGEYRFIPISTVKGRKTAEVNCLVGVGCFGSRSNSLRNLLGIRSVISKFNAGYDCAGSSLIFSCEL